jgi:RNA polymerase sigma-70 factor (ECF subfamily)
MTTASIRTVADAGEGIDWDAAWRQHARWLRTVVASRLGEASAVDDVVQQVGLAVARPEGRPTQGSQVAPWLYRVAVRQCLMHRRGAGRRRRFLERLGRDRGNGAHGSKPAGLDWLLRQERADLAGRALAELPELDRQLLLLKHTENWTYRQLADHLGVSLNVVEYRLLQARERLRRELAQSGVLETES